MGRCSTKELFKKIGLENINTNDYEIEFFSRKMLPDCRIINAKNYARLGEGMVAVYDAYDIPKNVIECDRLGCFNSGTLYLDASNVPEPEDGTVTYEVDYDATEWATGVIGFYIKWDKPSNLVGTLTISDKGDPTNANVYNFSYSSEVTDEHSLVIIDLTKEPDKVLGNGWTPSEDGADLTIDSGVNETGISTIGIFDSIEDFDLEDVITLGCVQNVSGTIDVALIDKMCAESVYDIDNVKGFERTLSVKKATPNYWLLNPLLDDDDEDEGADVITVKKVVPEDGIIPLPDMSEKDCSYYALQIKEGCDIDALSLKRTQIEAGLDKGHFYVDRENKVIKVDTFYKDKEILVKYPQKKEVKRQTARKSNIGKRTWGVRFSETLSDCSKIVYTLPNVKVTSFPQTINSSGDNNFDFTISIQPVDGDLYYTRDKILN